MPLNLKVAVEWVWNHRAQYSRWNLDLLTEQNTSSDSLKLSQSDAMIVFNALLRKRLLIGMGRDGKTLHYVLSDQDRDWFAYIAELASFEKLSPRTKNPTSNPPEEKPPYITDFKAFAGYHIQKNWKHLREAILAVIVIVLISGSAGFAIAWQLVVTSKNATIESLKTDNDSKDHQIKELNDNIEKIKKQVPSDNPQTNDSTLSLKRATLTLGGQLLDLRKRIDAKGDPDFFVPEFENRFEKRIEQIRTRLDEEGIDSQTLNDLDSGQLGPKTFKDRVSIIGTELIAMGNRMTNQTQLESK